MLWMADAIGSGTSLRLTQIQVHIIFVSYFIPRVEFHNHSFTRCNSVVCQTELRMMSSDSSTRVKDTQNCSFYHTFLNVAAEEMIYLVVCIIKRKRPCYLWIDGIDVNRAVKDDYCRRR